MKPLLIAALMMLPLMGCKQDATATLPPETMTAEAVGRYCGMNLLEHQGPRARWCCPGNWAHTGSRRRATRWPSP
ncbi:MAG: hypothetical protein Q4615_01975 [Paracoccus aminovorans]|nr:hypothetical protein [Paracoccus aminovorans]